MKFKKVILITLSLLVLLTIGAVSASDNITSDDLAIDDEPSIEISEVNDNSTQLSAGNDDILNTDGSFSDIQTMIDSANEGDTIVLSGNYAGTGSQININKTITIDGNNFKLDGKHSSRIFNVRADNVTLKNIIFINGNTTASGGAVYWKATGGNIINCQFSDNHAKDGGAVYFRGSNGNIEDSVFENNSAYYNGAVYMNSANGQITGCNFTNNYATDSAGALGWVKKSNGRIRNSRFTDNTAQHGGAVYVNNASNLRIENSEFENNVAFGNGGAIYWDFSTGGVITDSKFKNNNANDYGGGVYFDECENIAAVNCEFISCCASTRSGGGIYCYSPAAKNVSVSGCSFVDCSAKEYGGALRLNVSNSDVTGCNFINCSANYGGAVYLTGGSIVSDCNFTSCQSKNYGGAIYWDGKGGSLLKSDFVNCTANYGGAVYLKNADGYVSACSFIYCNSNNGGAVYLNKAAENSQLTNCTFINCSGENRGGAISWNYNGGKIETSTFIDNNASNGRAIYASGTSLKINDCIFNDASAASVEEVVNKGTTSNCSVNVKLETTTTLTINPDTVGLGEEISVLAAVKYQYTAIEATVNLYVDDVSIGSAKAGEEFKYAPSAAGTHSITAKFEGNENYLASQSETLQFTVKTKSTPDMTISVDDITYGENEIVKVTLPKDATNSVALNLLKDGKPVSNLTSGLTDGAASFELTGLDAGTYEADISYGGDSKYSEVSDNMTFIVRPTVIIEQNVTVGDEVRICMDFGCNVTDGVIVRVDNKAVAVLDIENGILNDTFSTSKLTAGDHNVTFQFSDDDENLFYSNVFNYWDVQAGKYLPVKYALYLSPIEVTIPKDLSSNEDGIVVLTFPENATGTLEVYVNGVRVLVVEIVNDMAVIDLSQYKNGNYNITFKYSGDDVYAGFTIDSMVNVTVKVSRIDAADLTIVYTSKAPYSVTVYGGDDKPVSGVDVTFLLGNEIYRTVATDSNGVASIELDMLPGTYKITSKAANVNVTKTLTVSHIVTLKTAKVKRSAKKLVLTASLAKVDGKYLKGKKIKFKFNGKKYNAKTNKKGVAKVTIKSKVLKKLKVGKKVKYQATYLKDTAKKTAKVKK